MNINNSSSLSELDFDVIFPDKQKIVNYVNGLNNLGIKDSGGTTLLMYVCLNEYSDIALQMLSKGPNAVNLSSANENGQTALAIACMLKLKQVILKMLEFGPDAVNINSKDNLNETAIMESIHVYRDHQEMMEVIEKMLDFGPLKLDLSIVNNNSYTALMLSCKYKLQEIALKMIGSYSGGQTYDLNLFQENEEGETALDIALRNDLNNVSDLISIQMREEEHFQMAIPSVIVEQEEKPKPKIYASGTIPSLSFKDMQLFQQNQSLSIDLNSDGWDPFLQDNENILTFLNEDIRDNIAIKYVGKVYLSKRSILQTQKEEATVFECLESNKKVSTNIVYNLPLFNIKKIGINISSDNAVGIEPEYIYMDGVNQIVSNNTSSDVQQNLFSIIPLPDKMLLSVISLEEVNNIGSGFSNASSLHCQAGQVGLAGLIVTASGMNHLKGGFFKKKRNNITLRKRKTKKSTLKKKKKKSTFKKKN